MIHEGRNSLAGLALDMRVFSALRRVGILSIERAALMRDDELLGLRFIGPFALRQLREATQAWLAQGNVLGELQPNKGEIKCPACGGTGFVTPTSDYQGEIKMPHIVWLHLWNDRYIYVLQQRLRVDGKPPRTLEQLGRQLDISRGRVQQIVEQGLRRLEKYAGEIAAGAIPAEETLDLWLELRPLLNKELTFNR